MINRKNDFYRDYYNTFIFVLILAIFSLVGLVGFVFYQIHHRPIPQFVAVNTKGQRILLTSFEEPNLLPSTIIKWASKAAVAAYTFDFVNYKQQIALVRPYFTPAGWADYQASISNVIQTITKNQLFVNGVVSGPPVISNQGDLSGKGYVWRVQIPFLVTYQSTETTTQGRYTVVITIMKVPTRVDPMGIGIDQFVMS